MGAEFNFKKLNAKTAYDAVAEGEEAIEQAAYDYGHAGYTGSFAECDGVHVTDYVAADEEDAEQWLGDNAVKWGPMLIVALKDGGYCAGAWCSS